MSFFRKLFGLGAGAGAPSAGPAKEVEHGGFVIRATPYAEGGQWQTAGVVAKDFGGELREHRFVRADRFATREDAEEFALRKGKQLVDEQGDRLFDRPPR
jgi:hypothetical protein